MSDRRRFLKGLTSLPLATVLANPRLAAAVSAGLREVEAKLSDGRTVKAALATCAWRIRRMPGHSVIFIVL